MDHWLHIHMKIIFAVMVMTNRSTIKGFRFFIIFKLPLILEHFQAQQHLEQLATQSSIIAVRELLVTRYIIIPQPIDNLLNPTFLVIVVAIAAVAKFAIIVAINFIRQQ